MSNASVIQLYEIGLRGRPVPRIAAGDLADPYQKPLLQRVADFWKTIVEIVQETRAMERKLLGRTTYRYFE
ncbi:MAG: hypothetical protein U1F54_19310 [Burkholderiales bacterium]